jgi:outer membrane immunogenic protein
MHTMMRLAMLLAILLGCCSFFSTSAQAQDFAPNIKVGVDYTNIQSNGPPGGCGCFSMNGGNVWVSLGSLWNLSAVAEVGSAGARNVDGSGTSLTITSYLFGPRYTWRKFHRVQPFAQALVGAARANGSFGQTLGANAFASSGGGGLDVNLFPHFSLRAFEADYYFTRFTNGINDHQNNLQLGAGIIFEFGGSR